ncbi:DUF821 domain protein [Aspergillus undulatus]|uniref:DUF821 domain protein n=1 Tax=Aspergillus undulatus TaxID=1810928 RepID=UPI003CCD04D6
MLNILHHSSLRFLFAGAIFSLLLTFLVFGLGRGSSLGFEGLGGDAQPGPYTLKSSSHCGNTASELNTVTQTNTSNQTEWGQGKEWSFTPHRDANNHGLSEAQCLLAFPKLFGEIDRVAQKYLTKNQLITFQDVDDVHRRGGIDGNGNGLVRAAIVDGKLYILDFGPQPFTFSRGKATLHSLNRALTAYAGRRTLPNIEFVLSTDDFVPDQEQGPIWSYSRRYGDEVGNGDWNEQTSSSGSASGIWLMPDFGYWSWPEVKVGSYSDIRRRIADVDGGLRFKNKKKQLLWRGSVASNPEIRGALLSATRGKPWSSTREINWDTSSQEDADNGILPMESHCTYQFLAHTEGRSFSGRGKYLLSCGSVVIAHKPLWAEMHHGALISSGPEANYVQVERDFSDLERKIEHLLDNPEVAERIAVNAFATFGERYLSPAAESCYWRALVRAYGGVSGFEPLLEVERTTGKKESGKGKGARVSIWKWVLHGVMIYEGIYGLAFGSGF